jgi:PDZ domain
MLKSTFALILLLATQPLLAVENLAAENLYQSNYKAQNNAGLKSLQAAPETKMYVSNHKDEDNISMLENGYDMMGSSDFEAGNVPAELALTHAKSIRADTVLVYSKYASKASNINKLEMIKEAAKTTGEVDASVLKGNEEQYKYFASYWAKLPPPLLGVHVVKLVRAETPADDGKVDREIAGLKILAVIKGSPAEKAGLHKADSITKIGDVIVNKPDDLFAAVKKYQGKVVQIGYTHDDEQLQTQVQLNTR